MERGDKVWEMLFAPGAVVLWRVTLIVVGWSNIQWLQNYQQTKETNQHQYTHQYHQDSTTALPLNVLDHQPTTPLFNNNNIMNVIAYHASHNSRLSATFPVSTCGWMCAIHHMLGCMRMLGVCLLRPLPSTLRVLLLRDVSMDIISKGDQWDLMGLTHP